ncbi:hypothetical protein [Algoriphagus namhaensis]
MNNKNLSILSGIAAGILATVILMNRKKEPKATRKSRELLNKIQSTAKDLKKTAKDLGEKGLSQGKSIVDNLATK